MNTSERSRIVTRRPPAATTSPGWTSLYSTRPETGVVSSEIIEHRLDLSDLRIGRLLRRIRLNQRSLGRLKLCRGDEIFGAAAIDVGLRPDSGLRELLRPSHLDLGQIVLGFPRGDIGFCAADARERLLDRRLGAGELRLKLRSVEPRDDLSGFD